MLKANALCTLDELKGFTGIDLTDTSKDLILEIYINSVSDAIEKLIGRNIFAKDYSERYKGTNTNELVLNQYPVNAIVSIKYVKNGAEYFTLEEDDYSVEAESGIVYRDEGWLKDGYSSLMSGRINFPSQHIRIEYNAGFTEVPSDLKLVCLQLCKDLYNYDDSDTSNLKSYSISDVREDYRDEIKPTTMHMKIINSYKGKRF